MQKNSPVFFVKPNKMRYIKTLFYGRPEEMFRSMQCLVFFPFSDIIFQCKVNNQILHNTSEFDSSKVCTVDLFFFGYVIHKT